MKHSLKQFLNLSIIYSLFLFSLQSQAKAGTPIDHVKAIAGDEIITQSDLDRIIRSRKDAGTLLKTPEEEWEILHHIIEERLIMQEARRRGVTVTDDELEFAIKDIEIRNRFPDRASLKSAVLSDHLSWDQYTKNLRNQLSALKLLTREVDTTVTLSNEVLNEYYDNHPEFFALPDRVRLRQILLHIPDGANNEVIKQIEEKANKISAEAQSGSDFSQLFQRYSEEINKQKDGDLGFFYRGDLTEKIDRVIFTLEEGEITQAIRTPAGIHIFKVVAQQRGRLKPFEQVEQSIKERLIVEKTGALRKKWISDLWERSYVEIK